MDHRGDDLIYAAEGGIDMINFLSKRGILMGDPGEDNIDYLIKKVIITKGDVAVMQFFFDRDYLQAATGAKDLETMSIMINWLMDHGSDPVQRVS